MDAVLPSEPLTTALARKQTAVNWRKILVTIVDALLVVGCGVGDRPSIKSAVEEIPHRRADVFGFDEEGVVAVIGVDDVVGDGHAGRAERPASLIGLQ